MSHTGNDNKAERDFEIEQDDAAREADRKHRSKLIKLMAKGEC